MKIVLLEKIGVSETVMKTYAERLASMGHTLVCYEKTNDEALLNERAKDADVIMLANMPLPASTVEKAEKLKYVDVAFTGVDHIPLSLLKEKGVAVSNASGYANDAVAELCISFMIQLSRNLAQVEARCRKGGTKDGLVGNLLKGKTVGIVGAGAIGKTTARLAKCFGCKTLAYSRRRVNDPSFDEETSLDELLKRSDIISLHCPLTNETRGLIGKAQLATMKKSAILINTARGPVVDTDAVVEALQKGIIAGYATDVFESEPPLKPDHPLLHSPNTIVTPHIGFASAESLELRAKIVFDNLFAWLDGKQLNAV